jgi:hypothetical protein
MFMHDKLKRCDFNPNPIYIYMIEVMSNSTLNNITIKRVFSSYSLWISINKTIRRLKIFIIPKSSKICSMNSIPNSWPNKGADGYICHYNDVSSLHYQVRLFRCCQHLILPPTNFLINRENPPNKKERTQYINRKLFLFIYLFLIGKNTKSIMWFTWFASSSL